MVVWVGFTMFDYVDWDVTDLTGWSWTEFASTDYVDETWVFCVVWVFETCWDCGNATACVCW